MRAPARAAKPITASHIVSESFAGKGRVERHRIVYALLADEFAAGVHALALQTLAPGEA